MSAGGHDTSGEIARGLSQILTQALAAGAPVRALEAARDLAQVLSLRGLDRLLAALVSRPERPWPPALRPAVDRLLGAAADCAREGSVAALRQADGEMGRMADTLEGAAGPRETAAAGGAGARLGASLRATPVALSEVLAGLPVQGDPGHLRRTHLVPLVAAALRAALDWLTDEGGARRPLAVEHDGSALEVTCDGVAFSGIQPAGEVLAGVGGHLGPNGARPGAWSLRVPVFAERETFLMFEQDELLLAVPWHAVARIRLVPAEAIEAMAQRQGLAVLPALARDPRPAAEQPVIVVALGRKRACLVADRLVWRMAADVVPPPGAAPAPGITRAVRSDDDEVYWVLEPSWLLRGIAAPTLPDAPRRPAAAPTSGAPAFPPAAPRPPAAPVETPRAAAPHERPALHVLRPEDVEPIEEEEEETERTPAPASETGGAASGPAGGAPAAPVAEPQEPEPAATPATPGPASPTPAVPRPAAEPARALIVDDSITARVFLMRLLEQQGFVVSSASTAAEGRAMVSAEGWTVVFADVELPDARGADLLPELGRRLGHSAALVALVRDAADEMVARKAGVAATLRKPFERDSLERLLEKVAPRDRRGGTAPSDPGIRP